MTAIPGTSVKRRLDENLAVFDFQLSEDEMAAIDGLDLGRTQFPEGS